MIKFSINKNAFQNALRITKQAIGSKVTIPALTKLKIEVEENEKRDITIQSKDKYKQFRNKERTKCSSCEKCENWEYCLGGSFHTWNFEDNSQNKCVYKMIENK